MPPPTYEEALEVKKVADVYLERHHQALFENEIRIEYIFRDDVPKLNGRPVWGAARKISGLAAFIGRDPEREDGSYDKSFFAMVIAKAIWVILTQQQREALVDHLLCRMAVYEKDNNERVLSLLDPDVKEFAAIMQRHGAWYTDVRKLLKEALAHQPELPGLLEQEDLEMVDAFGKKMFSEEGPVTTNEIDEGDGPITVTAEHNGQTAEVKDIRDFVQARRDRSASSSAAPTAM